MFLKYKFELKVTLQIMKIAYGEKHSVVTP